MEGGGGEVSINRLDRGARPPTCHSQRSGESYLPWVHGSLQEDRFLTFIRKNIVGNGRRPVPIPLHHLVPVPVNTNIGGGTGRRPFPTMFVTAQPRDTRCDVRINMEGPSGMTGWPAAGPISRRTDSGDHQRSEM